MAAWWCLWSFPSSRPWTLSHVILSVIHWHSYPGLWDGSMLLKLSLLPSFLSSFTCHTICFSPLRFFVHLHCISSHSEVSCTELFNSKMPQSRRVETFATQPSGTHITHAWRIFLYNLIPKLYCNSLGTGLGVLGLLLHCLTCCTAGYPQSVLSVWVSAASQATGALPAPEEDPRWSVSEWTSHYT